MANPEPTSDSNQDVSEPTLVKNVLSSCLRDSNKSPKRQLTNRSVSFPENDNQIVTGYLEPVNPWEFAESTNKETVLLNYTKSCEKHQVLPIKTVLDQIENYDYERVGNDRFDLLDLKGVWLTLGCCEALEEVLKRLQFVKIDLEDTALGNEAAVALFDMIEYYEAASRLNVSSNNGIGVRGWQAASRMLKRTKCLEELECRNTALSEQVVPILSRALRLGTQLHVLKLEACSLAGRSLVVLVAGLKLNTTLKELYLGENNLGPSDALQLSGLLKCNTTLQLLDLSNNGLEDNGVLHICDALCEQSRPAGLGILILWNNKLGPSSSHHIARALKGNNTLETLNVGHNELGDTFLKDIEEALIENRSLLRLGIQSTSISGEGALVLANILSKNPTLQRIDVRDNNMEVSGVLALAESMKNNKSITQIDLDDRPRGRISETLERYREAVEQVRGACWRNETGGDEALLRARLSAIAARKISLTCDTLRPPPPPPPQQTLATQPQSPTNTTQSFLQALCWEWWRRLSLRLIGLPLAGEVSWFRAALASKAYFKRKLSLESPLSRHHNVNTETKKGGRLRSPAPSPIPSPVASPSPTRTRFQVSKVTEDSPPDSSPVFNFGAAKSNRFRVTVVEPHEQPSPAPPPPITVHQAHSNPSTPPRTRKLSSWVSPGFESKAASSIEKLLGLFQNPFRAASAGGNSETSSDGSGATWPSGRSPPTSVDTTTHSASLTHLAVIPPTG